MIETRPTGPPRGVIVGWSAFADLATAWFFWTRDWRDSRIFDWIGGAKRDLPGTGEVLILDFVPETLAALAGENGWAEVYAQQERDLWNLRHGRRERW